MTNANARPDKKILYLLSNGDINAWSTQSLYEQAWNVGIRPLNEGDLKPDFLTRRKRRRIGGACMDSVGISKELMGKRFSRSNGIAR
jgi:hypothetical protein